ncbi:hypothetical protein MRB53_040667 [Persea americana]|nr:hypothetical protein MRB53_040667 [Persea americana]
MLWSKKRREVEKNGVESRAKQYCTRRSVKQRVEAEQKVIVAKRKVLMTPTRRRKTCGSVLAMGRMESKKQNFSNGRQGFLEAFGNHIKDAAG